MASLIGMLHLVEFADVFHEQFLVDLWMDKRISRGTRIPADRARIETRGRGFKGDEEENDLQSRQSLRCASHRCSAGQA